MPSHCLNQWWLTYWRMNVSLGPNESNWKCYHIGEKRFPDWHWSVTCVKYTYLFSEDTSTMSLKNISFRAHFNQCRIKCVDATRGNLTYIPRRDGGDTHITTVFLGILDHWPVALGQVLDGCGISCAITVISANYNLYAIVLSGSVRFKFIMDILYFTTTDTLYFRLD